MTHWGTWSPFFDCWSHLDVWVGCAPAVPGHSREFWRNLERYEIHLCHGQLVLHGSEPEKLQFS